MTFIAFSSDAIRDRARRRHTGKATFSMALAPINSVRESAIVSPYIANFARIADKSRDLPKVVRLSKTGAACALCVSSEARRISGAFASRIVIASFAASTAALRRSMSACWADACSSRAAIFALKACSATCSSMAVVSTSFVMAFRISRFSASFLPISMRFILDTFFHKFGLFDIQLSMCISVRSTVLSSGQPFVRFVSVRSTVLSSGQPFVRRACATMQDVSALQAELYHKNDYKSSLFLLLLLPFDYSLTTKLLQFGNKIYQIVTSQEQNSYKIETNYYK